jgi:hypothetical protein
MSLPACVDQVSDRDFRITNAATIHTNSLLGLSARSGRQSLVNDSPLRRKGDRICVLTLYGDRKPTEWDFAGLPPCRCTQATLSGKTQGLPVCAIARLLPCPNNQRRLHAWLRKIRFRCSLWRLG